MKRRGKKRRRDNKLECCTLTLLKSKRESDAIIKKNDKCTAS